MATQWVLGKVSDALQPTVSGAVSTAGSFAGGAVNAVGNSINGVGDGINNSIRRYGDGAKDYGNSLMDWTKAGSARGQTASNPLGLGTGVAQGKSQVTSPSVYHAAAKPKPNPSKTLMTTGKPMGTQKRIAAPTKKTATSTAPTSRLKSDPPPKAVSKSAVGAAKSTNPAARTISSASKPKAPVKAVTPATQQKIKKPNYVAASNPLGLA